MSNDKPNGENGGDNGNKKSKPIPAPLMTAESDNADENKGTEAQPTEAERKAQEVIQKLLQGSPLSDGENQMTQEEVAQMFLNKLQPEVNKQAEEIAGILKEKYPHLNDQAAALATNLGLMPALTFLVASVMVNSGPVSPVMVIGNFCQQIQMIWAKQMEAMMFAPKPGETMH